MHIHTPEYQQGLQVFPPPVAVYSVALYSSTGLRCIGSC